MRWLFIKDMDVAIESMETHGVMARTDSAIGE